MIYSTLVQELRQSLLDSSVDDYILKIQNQDTNESYKAITEILEVEKANPCWLPVHLAWQTLQGLTQKLINRDKAVTPTIYEEAIQSVATAIAAVSVDNENITTAKLLSYTLKGLNNRNMYLDSLSGWKPAALAAQAATKAMKSFNNKNRQENLKPILAAIDILNLKIIDIALPVLPPQPQTETPNEAEAQNVAEFQFTEDELTQIVEDLAMKFTKYQDNYKTLAQSFHIIDPHIGAAEQLENLCENLECIKEMTAINLTLSDKVNTSFQHFLDTCQDTPEFKRLAALELEIEARMSEGKVIPYDEKLASDCDLSQDQKDAWRQHAYINYESIFNMKSLYNRMRETVGLIHSAPVVGSVSQILRGAIRQLPGAQTVMGAQDTDYKQAMTVLKKAVIAAKNEKMDYFTNLRQAFVDSTTIGNSLIEQAGNLLSSARTIQHTLKTKEETLENNQELNHKIEEVKSAVDNYLIANNGIINRLARRIFGINAGEFEIAKEMKARLEKTDTIKDVDKLRELLEQANRKLLNKKGKSQLKTLISSIPLTPGPTST